MFEYIISPNHTVAINSTSGKLYIQNSLAFDRETHGKLVLQVTFFVLIKLYSSK